ncbi:hypothetical protein [Herbaspirillum sp. B65]|uniref:hypothetical protein n=1 Tax=Herbaspirillum sp. B65 TaxID=137708 RepID=UPI002091AB3C|nr:hypothetical protein [Herbaspirillum sp. B65]
MSSSYDPLRSRHPGVTDAAPEPADLTPVRDEQHEQDDDGLSGGALVAGFVLSAGLGLWLGRKRRQRRAQAVSPGAPATPCERELIPHGLERALRLVSLAMPLIAAWRRGSARAKVAAAKAQLEKPPPPDAPARVDSSRPDWSRSLRITWTRRPRSRCSRAARAPSKPGR